MILGGRSNRRRWLVASAGVAACTLFVQLNEAQATSCVPWLDVGWPAQGGELPLGSFVYIASSCGGNPLDLTVTVDEAPAELVEGPVRGAYAISPTPVLGAVVAIDPGPNFEEELVEFVPVSFTVSTAVESTLSAPTLALHYEFDFDYIESVDYWGMSAQVLGPQSNGGRPIFYAFEGPNAVSSVLVSLQGVEPVTAFWRADQLPVPGKEVCITVTSMDVHGAEAAPVSECIVAEAEPNLDCEGEVPPEHCNDDTGSDCNPETENCDTDSDSSGTSGDTGMAGDAGTDPGSDSGGGSGADPGSDSGGSNGDTDGGPSSDDGRSGCSVGAGAGTPIGAFALLGLLGLGRRRRRIAIGTCSKLSKDHRPRRNRCLW